MNSPRILLVLAGLAVLAVLLVPPPSAHRVETPEAVRNAPWMAPMPTEHRLDTDAERRNRAGRKEWMEKMHAAAPGTDWRLIERQNGIALQTMRQMGEREDQLWSEIGSRNQAGRMHCMALSLVGDSLYAGSSRGGVWKGSLDGEGWRPLSDNLFGGAHDLAVAGGNPEVVTSITDDGLIHYTDDGGLTWQVPAGLPSFFACKRILTDPSDPNLVYLLARPTYITLYRSEDGGRSYTFSYPLTSSIVDMWNDRVVGGDLYLLDRVTLYRSSDRGETFDTIGTVATGYPGGVVLAGSEAGAPTLYAAEKLNNQWELYRSEDGGVTWEYRYDINDFWETLCASIYNPQLVLFAGVECWRSGNGGASFTKINNWWDYYSDPLNKLHADFPGLDAVVIPGQGEAFYCATDGGLYRGNSSMTQVTNISLVGLGVSQYYDILTDVLDPYRLLAGSQDQGYQRSTGPTRGPTWDFDQLISGDYGHLTAGFGSHDIVFSVYPGFVLVQEGANSPALHQLDFPADENHLWMPPIIGNPENPLEFYFCATRLHLGHWYGGTSVGYTLPSTQDFTVAGGSYLSYFSISPADLDRRIAVTDNGKLWYSTDHGASWTLSADNGPSSHYFYGTAIQHSYTDADRAWVGGSGYSGPAVYRTDDGGATWTPAAAGLPSTLVYGLALESPSNEVLYAATAAGPYRLDPLTETWQYLGGTAAPLTTYWCVEAVPAIETVRFGTYGRGIWEYDVHAATSVATGESEAGGGGAGGGDSAGGGGGAAGGGVGRAGDRFALANFPNPFNPQTTIRYDVAEGASIRLAIYDVRGRELVVLVDERQECGKREVRWDGRDARGEECASGVYLAQVVSETASGRLRLTLIR